MALNLYTFFVYFGILILPVFIFVYLSGGSYLKMRIKSKLPWFAGKGKNHLHIDKTGTARWDYVILRKGNVIGKGDNATIIEGTHHSLLDLTKLDKHTTIHQLDKEPLIVTVEGAPTNVLVKQRDYAEDISKLDYTLNKINEVISSEDAVKKSKLQKDLLVMFNKLLGAFKYLEPARRICYFTIKKTKELDDKNQSDLGNIDYNELLKIYKIAIENLITIMKKKSMTMINFTDYFTEINLSRIFNSYFKDANQLGRRESLIGMQKENKLQKIGGIVLILGMLFVGYLVYDMSGKMSVQTESLDKLSVAVNDLSDILIDSDTNTVKISNQNNSENINSNPITGGN